MPFSFQRHHFLYYLLIGFINMVKHAPAEIERILPRSIGRDGVCNSVSSTTVSGFFHSLLPFGLYLGYGRLVT